MPHHEKASTNCLSALCSVVLYVTSIHIRLFIPCEVWGNRSVNFCMYALVKKNSRHTQAQKKGKLACHFLFLIVHCIKQSYIKEYRRFLKKNFGIILSEPATCIHKQICITFCVGGQFCNAIICFYLTQRQNSPPKKT